jgi:hypothetical protein
MHLSSLYILSNAAHLSTGLEGYFRRGHAMAGPRARDLVFLLNPVIDRKRAHPTSEPLSQRYPVVADTFKLHSVLVPEDPVARLSSFGLRRFNRDSIKTILFD